MIKCPLCGWNNHESTQLCVSCGGDLENRSGLVQENENCFSFTPPRRILDKGVGVTGSGNDLVFRFSNSGFVIWLIIFKIIFLAAFPYATVRLYREDNTLFYIMIPLTLLFMLDITGWILLKHGGRKKRRKAVSLGLRLLYAFHAIGMAYGILTMLIAIYFAIALGFSWNLGMSLGPALEAISSDVTIGLLVAATAVLLMMVIYLNICAKFFHHMHDVFARNEIKFYPFTIIIAIVFVLLALVGAASVALVVYKDYALSIVKDYDVLSFLIALLVPDKWGFAAGCIILVTIISAISGAMVIGYIRNYKKLFVKS